MFKLRDFMHLPQMDALINEMIAGEKGMIIIAGPDPRSFSTTVNASSAPLPSGRSTFFNILVQEMLDANPITQANLVTKDKNVIRVPRHLKRRVRLSQVSNNRSYANLITEGMEYRNGLLLVDRLSTENILHVFRASQEGIPVVAQLDTILWGNQVVHQIMEMDISPEQLNNLSWIVSIQRMPILCENCKQPDQPNPELQARLRNRYPDLSCFTVDKQDTSEAGDAFGPGLAPGVTFYRPGSCSRCRSTGRSGDMAVFDVFRAGVPSPQLLTQRSLLPLEEYMYQLAALGHLCLDDLLRLETDQLRRTYALLKSSDISLEETKSALTRKLAELEAANRVLLQRTEVTMSLQDIAQALINSADITDLATRVCKRAGELCVADRAILYYRRTNQPAGDWAEVLAVVGWPQDLLHKQLNAGQVFLRYTKKDPVTYNHLPPGINELPVQKDEKDPKKSIQAGLYVPLVAQQQQVGLMIVQSTQKKLFNPGEIALLQTFANQAALALQRAGLVDELRGKIQQLEAAQVELIKKERLEHELELARQVQQRMLPRWFPEVTGYTFAARNEPARQVGGDFYDVIDLDDDHFAMVIADVSDKGMASALYMALTRSLIRAEAHQTLSPLSVLSNVNRLLLELGEPSRFISVFYGIIEKSSRKLTYARAGHDHPMLIRDGAIQPLGGKGSVLGVLDENELDLSEEHIQLQSGDSLVLYTDGLTDVLNADDQFFGLDSLKLLFQSLTPLSPDALCSAIFENLILYQGSAEQFDDMTLLILGVE